MMDELVQDLVSALEQTSEQNKLGELWEEMVLNPLQQRRQIRRRRGRKRRCDYSLHPPEHQRCLSEASESSVDEAGVSRDCREGSALALCATSATNCSDSDDVMVTAARSPWRPPVKARQHSWPESDSLTENTPGRALRRRRKVKRVTSDVMVSLQQQLKVAEVGGEQSCSHRSSKKQRLSRVKKETVSWMGVDGQPDGAGLMAKECWKDMIPMEAKDQRDASDENMSECDTSSICSSDPGLFTNDEGRQGDDEQSDWFFEGDCGAGKGVSSLMPGWDPDSPLALEDKCPPPMFLQPARPSQRGYHARLNPLTGLAARCIRKGRRRLPSKDNSMPVFVERFKHFAHYPYQRGCWLPSAIGKRGRSQFNPLCPLPLYHIDVAPENSHRRCSSSMCKNKPANLHLGMLCTADVKRRKKTTVVPITAPASIPAHTEGLGEATWGAGNPSFAASMPAHTEEMGEAAWGAGNPSTPEATAARGASRFTGLQPYAASHSDAVQHQSLFSHEGNSVDN